MVVLRKGIARVMGVLAVARAIGDAQLKPYVTAEPEVTVFHRAEETWFVILATDGEKSCRAHRAKNSSHTRCFGGRSGWQDFGPRLSAYIAGLWDVVSNKEAVEMVLERLLDDTSLFRGARRLCSEAYKRGSTDNISVVVVDLRTEEWARFTSERTEWEKGEV